VDCCLRELSAGQHQATGPKKAHKGDHIKKNQEEGAIGKSPGLGCRTPKKKVTLIPNLSETVDGKRARIALEAERTRPTPWVGRLVLVEVEKSGKRPLVPLWGSGVGVLKKQKSRAKKTIKKWTQEGANPKIRFKKLKIGGGKSGNVGRGSKKERKRNQ